jgi:hypothetical protein
MEFTMRLFAPAIALAAIGLSTSGCVLLGLGAAAGAGAVAADELNENDGKFDPLEKTRENVGEKLGVGDDGGRRRRRSQQLAYSDFRGAGSFGFLRFLAPNRSRSSGR